MSGITFRDAKFAKEDHPSLVPLTSRGAADRAPSDADAVEAVMVTVAGIRGRNSPAPVNYQVFADVRSICREIPPVWVLSPDDATIEHFNIWRNQTSHARCELLEGEYPAFCWGHTADTWKKLPIEQRTLSMLVDVIKQFLSKENPNSPAR
jgi:hypothetical protein